MIYLQFILSLKSRRFVVVHLFCEPEPDPAATTLKARRIASLTLAATKSAYPTFAEHVG